MGQLISGHTGGGGAPRSSPSPTTTLTHSLTFRSPTHPHTNSPSHSPYSLTHSLTNSPHPHSVGLYVPGGTAVLPSSALMLAVPAQIAGCRTVVMATPPRQDGSISPEVSKGLMRGG